ncbi:Hyaluronan synthase 3 [Dissophora globulifera]|nr:Hyaluronan synthase 3 [Dissophora globulifera]
MPPHPPEEISVLSHQSIQDVDPRLTVHPKDPLAFASSQNLGLKGHRHGAPLTLDYSMMARQQIHQHRYQHFPQDNQQDQSHMWKGSYNSSHYSHQQLSASPSLSSASSSLSSSSLASPIDFANDVGLGGSAVETLAIHGKAAMEDRANGILQGTMNRSSVEIHQNGGFSEVGGRSTSTTMASMIGLQMRKGTQLSAPLHLHQQQQQFRPSQHSLPAADEISSQLPTPSATPVSFMEPTRESNAESRNRRGSYFDQSLYHHSYSHYLGSQQQQNTTQFSSVPSPLSSNYPPIDAFHSAHAPCVPPHFQHQQHYEYISPQSSPADLVAHYRSPHNDVFPDAAIPTLKGVPPPPYMAAAATGAQSHGLKSSPVSLWKKAAWVGFTMAIFLLPYCVFKACFQLQVSAGAWQSSLTYGMLMTVDFLAVIIFSALNRRKVNQRVKNRDPDWVGMSTGILAVGYREDPVLLEGCLKSLRAMRYQRNQRILLVVDGDEPQDEYMAQIFVKIFEKQGAAVFRPNFLCMDRAASDKEREDLVRQIAYHPGPVCVMQPHRGKRSAMYTGFAALLQQGLESVVVTDSDTYLDPNVCKELAFALSESPIIGAATGDVRIYNTSTWVSFLSSLRYWFAFNLERGAQSYHSVVNCVSGPLGIYRMSIVADVMDNWACQSFLGVFCTYGDDRHLTNLVLREGFKVKFSHYAICYTDTPIRFIAWVTQQTRWSKSFFREIPIQLGCIHLHSPWMTYALLYQLIYPMMMVYNLVSCIYMGTGSQMAWWLMSISLVGAMKTVYAVAVTGEKKFFFTTAYGFLYMVGYVPAKIYAALTLYDNSWGTSARLFRNFTQLQNYIAPVSWATILLLGFLHNTSRYSQLTPVPEGQAPPFLTDAMIIRGLIVFGVVYIGSYLWFFVRTGIITRDYKRDFSYEELYENMSYTFVDGGKRKVARFEV